MDCLPIASLEQRGPDFESKFIKGVVSLIWPYSSSAGKAAFLVADPDFRQRHRKGQVRVRLQGAAARAVAKSRFSIGDEVLLGLRGVKVVENDAGISTPGKSVELELQYGHYITMEVLRDGEKVANVAVEELNSPPPHTSFGTPGSNELAVQEPFIYHDHSVIDTPSTGHTPLFHRKVRTSGGSLGDSPFDPFIEDDVETLSESRRKRVRSSWGTGTRWRMAGQTPNPEKPSNDHISPQKPNAPSTATSKAVKAPMYNDIEKLQSTPVIDSSLPGPSSIPTPTKFKPFRDPVPTVSSVRPTSRAKPLKPTKSRPISVPDESYEPSSTIEIADLIVETQIADLLEPVIPNTLSFQQDTIEPDEQLVEHLTEDQAADPMEGFVKSPHHPPSPAGHSPVSPSKLKANPKSSLKLPTSSSSPELKAKEKPTMMGPPLIIPQNPKTPELNPVTPSALPLPSPFPQDALSGVSQDKGASYFPPPSTFGSTPWPTEIDVPDSAFGFSFGAPFGSPPKSRTTKVTSIEEPSVTVAEQELEALQPADSASPRKESNDLADFIIPETLEIEKDPQDHVDIQETQNADEQLHQAVVTETMEDQTSMSQSEEFTSSQPSLSVLPKSPIPEHVSDSIDDLVALHDMPLSLPSPPHAEPTAHQAEVQETPTWQLPSIQHILRDFNEDYNQKLSPLNEFPINTQQSFQVPTKSSQIFNPRPPEDDFIDLTQQEPSSPMISSTSFEKPSPLHRKVLVPSSPMQVDDDQLSLPEAADENDESNINYSQAELDDILDNPYPSQVRDSLPLANDIQITGFNPYDDEEEWARLPSSPMGSSSYDKQSIARSSLAPESPQRQRIRDRTPRLGREISDGTTLTQNHESIPPVFHDSIEPNQRKNIIEETQFTEKSSPRYRLRGSTTPRRDTQSQELSQSMAGWALDLMRQGHNTKDNQANSLPAMQEEPTQDPETATLSQVKVIQETPQLAHPNQEQSTISEQESSQAVLDMLSNSRRPDIRGFRTAMNYYTPLQHLVNHMNRSSQYDSHMNVMAVVARSASKPERADKGARDWFTKFRITQPDAWPTTYLVSVFRPFERALPEVEKGDIVLLSSFDVVPLKGGTAGLKSSDGCGWHTWKTSGGSLGAEADGPPAEFGDEEREVASTMAKWWNNAGKEDARL